MIFDAEVIAVVGVAKNCGKTTTLNALTAAAAAAGKRIGLVSMGIDGERSDVLLGTEKPPIPARAGDLVATSRAAIEASTARVEYVESLGFSTPLGEAFIAHVLEPGAIVLGGMRHREDIRLAVQRLRAVGAHQIWIDGAYGRIAAAQPGLADAIVVASGAIAGPDAEHVAAATCALIDRLVLPRIEVQWQVELVDAAIEADVAAVGGLHRPPQLLGGSALVALDVLQARWDDDTSAVAIPGLVSDSVLRGLQTAVTAGATLLIPDPTCLQAESRAIRSFRRHWDIRARRAAELLAIAYNPQSVVGPGVPMTAVVEILRRSYPKTPVFNPAVGIH